MKTTTNIIYKRFPDLEMQADQATICQNWQQTHDFRIAAGLPVHELWKYIKEPSDALKTKTRQQIMKMAALTLIRKQPYFHTKQVTKSESEDEIRWTNYDDVDNGFDQFIVKE